MLVTLNQVNLLVLYFYMYMINDAFVADTSVWRWTMWHCCSLLRFLMCSAIRRFFTTSRRNDESMEVKLGT